MEQQGQAPNPSPPKPAGMRSKWGKVRLVVAAQKSFVKAGEAYREGQEKYPLIYAARNEQLPMMRDLLEKGADVDGQDIYGDSALFWTARRGNLEAMKLLFEKGAAVDKPDNNGDTALFTAIRNGQDQAAKMLLEHKADPNRAEKDGTRLLSLAARKGNEEMMNLLIDANAEPNVKDPVHGETPLISAAMRGMTETVQKLLKAKAEVDTKDDGGNDALMYAGRHPQIKELIESAQYPLIFAARHNEPEEIKKLLKAGHKVNETDPHGYTALLEAALKGNSECFCLLVDGGADVNVKNQFGHTASFYVAQHSIPEMRLKLKVLILNPKTPNPNP
mmetsp:Transcript_26656/g.41719  ORF Transcript_26656/g.41719 Transcript_26656/m.41719 type:complete len:333 (+) Transcript_26656:50-1048(+)